MRFTAVKILMDSQLQDFTLKANKMGGAIHHATINLS